MSSCSSYVYCAREGGSPFISAISFALCLSSNVHSSIFLPLLLLLLPLPHPSYLHSHVSVLMPLYPHLYQTEWSPAVLAPVKNQYVSSTLSQWLSLEEEEEEEEEEDLINSQTIQG